MKTEQEMNSKGFFKIVNQDSEVIGFTNSEREIYSRFGDYEELYDSEDNFLGWKVEE